MAERLTVKDIDDAIDARMLGATSWTTPSGVSVTLASMDDLLKARAVRKADETDATGGIVPQYVEFGR